MKTSKMKSFHDALITMAQTCEAMARELKALTPTEMAKPKKARKYTPGIELRRPKWSVIERSCEDPFAKEIVNALRRHHKLGAFESAKVCGVSPATFTRFLRGDGVTEGTAARIITGIYPIYASVKGRQKITLAKFVMEGKRLSEGRR